MFTENSKPEEAPRKRKRGRPPGRTKQGDQARARLYRHAVRLIAKRGYEDATLRDIAKEAGVSPALLYRYFPGKRAVVFELYDDLSRQYADRAAAMPQGTWRERALFALRTSLAVLEPHRQTIAGLVPVLVGSADDGVFAHSAAFSRLRVQGRFEEAVAGARDAPPPEDARALGRILYLVHLAVLLWWTIDRTEGQRGTSALLALGERVLPALSLAFRLPRVRRFVREADALVRESLFGESQEASS
jgi:AcrR family transcriptional regulator